MKVVELQAAAHTAEVCALCGQPLEEVWRQWLASDDTYVLSPLCRDCHASGVRWVGPFPCQVCHRQVWTQRRPSVYRVCSPRCGAITRMSRWKQRQIKVEPRPVVIWCDCCKRMIPDPHLNQRFCSRACLDAARYEPPPAAASRLCQYCGRSFVPKHDRNREADARVVRCISGICRVAYDREKHLSRYHPCLDCGELISKKGVRCKPCAYRERLRLGTNALTPGRPKNGIETRAQRRARTDHPCISCGAMITERATRCKSCATTARYATRV